MSNKGQCPNMGKQGDASIDDEQIDTKNILFRL
jgi:hypothetical protein